MIVMPANNRGMVVGWLAGRFPGRIGHLYSPGSMAAVYPWLPYALDNGRFSVWATGAEWSEFDYIALLDRASGNSVQPTWALVPDVVADRDGTLREWEQWSHRIRDGYGWKLAFAVQDGMRHSDVPADADVVFLGGSTEWKRRTLHDWCDAFPRVHVGRINTNRWLWECHEAGAESCDGTGWIRGDQAQLAGLVDYLERSAKQWAFEGGGGQ